jgi:hypothetical protein
MCVCESCVSIYVCVCSCFIFVCMCACVCDVQDEKNDTTLLQDCVTVSGGVIAQLLALKEHSSDQDVVINAGRALGHLGIPLTGSIHTCVCVCVYVCRTDVTVCFFNVVCAFFLFTYTHTATLTKFAQREQELLGFGISKAEANCALVGVLCMREWCVCVCVCGCV